VSVFRREFHEYIADIVDRSLPGQHPPKSLELNEIGQRHKRNSDGDQRQSIRDEIGVDHEGKAAKQRHDRTLLLTVDKETKTDRAEQQTP